MSTVLENPGLYDLLYQDVTADVDFYRSLLKDVNEIVEYGAGSGRITIPLARENHKVLAVDNEPKMLDKLEEKMNYLPLEVRERIHPLLADIVGLRFEQPRECILVPFTTFNYLLDKKAQAECLKNIANSLANNGIAVFELITLNTYPELWSPVSTIAVDTLHLSNGSYYRYSRTTEFDAESGLLHQIRVFDLYTNQGVFLKRYTYDWTNCYISLDEFKDMALLYGLSVSRVYGDTSFAQYSEKDSNDLFVVLKKLPV